MRYSIRKIDIKKDKEFVLDCHCKTNFNCDSDWAVKVGYENYKNKWFSTKDPDEFLEALIKSFKDERTLGLIVEDEAIKIGYCWVRFYDVSEYDLVIAEIDDILIIDGYQRRGVATFLINYIEEKCKENGACVLRAGTGINNMASIKLHEKAGFKKYRVELEKIIDLKA